MMITEIETQHGHQLFVGKDKNQDPGIGSEPFGDKGGQRSNYLLPTQLGWSQLANYALEVLGIQARVEEKSITTTDWVITEYEDA